ncbi:transcription factor SPT20 homolog [Ceratitis capitata]|uniref:transcription factor SPT20 homolog n=1 Tax=Ceratitis capitata TaxID=7213 RepID=UPI000329E911|nr:transcription factor SPT20 homolog [Ceratitis capitata]
MNLKYVNFGGVFTTLLLLQAFMPPGAESKPEPGRKGSMALGVLAGLTMGGAAAHFATKHQMKKKEELPPNCQKQIVRQQDPQNPGRYIETESVVCTPLENQQPPQQQQPQYQPQHPAPAYQQTVSSQAELSKPQKILYPNLYVPQQQQQLQQPIQRQLGLQQQTQAQQALQQPSYYMPALPCSPPAHPQPATVSNSQSAEEQNHQAAGQHEPPKAPSPPTELQQSHRQSPSISSFIQRIRQRLAHRRAQQQTQVSGTQVQSESQPAQQQQKPAVNVPEQVAQAAAAQPDQYVQPQVMPSYVQHQNPQYPVGHQHAIGFVPPPQPAQQPQSGQTVQSAQPPQLPAQQPEHVQPVHSVQPAQPAPAAQPAQLVPQAQPAEQVQSAPAAAPAQPVQSIQSAQPAQISQPAQPSQPAQSAQPLQPVNNPQTAQPAQPAQPAQMIYPALPVQQLQPAQSVQPMQPVAPVQPAQPAQPSQVFVMSKKTRYFGKSSAERILQTNLVLMMMMAFLVIWWK